MSGTSASGGVSGVVVRVDRDVWGTVLDVRPAPDRQHDADLTRVAKGCDGGPIVTHDGRQIRMPRGLDGQAGSVLALDVTPPD